MRSKKLYIDYKIDDPVIEQKVLDKYPKLTIQQIADSLYIREPDVRKVLNKFKIARTNYSKSARVDINHNYFENIDTEEKAYFLGLLYADGNIKTSANSVFLVLNKKDDYILKKFITLVQPDKILKYYENIACLFFTSVKLKQDLIRLGCVPAKSLILKFPTEEQVPKKLIHHFIRGYFDGDGCVYIKNKNQVKSPQLGVSLVGTKDFLTPINKIFADISPNKFETKLVCRLKDNPYTFEFNKGGNIACKAIFDYFYTDATIYLQRKYDIFKNSFTNQNKQFESL